MILIYHSPINFKSTSYRWYSIITKKIYINYPNNGLGLLDYIDLPRFYWYNQYQKKKFLKMEKVRCRRVVISLIIIVDEVI